MAARASEPALPPSIEAPRAVAEPATKKRGSKLPLIAIAADAVVGTIVVVVIATRGGGEAKPAKPAAAANQAQVDEHLRAAASRIADGKLVNQDGDAALDHLLAAKRLAPDNADVKAQLGRLADTFEKLGDSAAATKDAKDLAEAAAHYVAALNAEPDRAAVKKKLADVENRARGGR